MQRIPRHSLLATLLAFLSLIAVAILPSVASATPPTCPDDDGIECILVISAPASVPADQPFTVKVFVTTDGTTLARSDSCASKVEVRLNVSDGDSYDQSYFANASAAVATFIINVPSGSYTLTASQAGGDFPAPCDSYFYDEDSAPLIAVTVLAGQPIYPCPDNVVCDQTTSGSGSAATLFADTGTFDPVFFGPLIGQGCGDLGPLDPNGVLNFTYTADPQLPEGSVKTIVLALSPALVTKGIGQYKICYSSPNFLAGYLAACSKKVGPPCVLFKTSTQHNGAFFGIQVPPGDPFLYPR